MINFLKRLFGSGPKINFTNLVKEGAIIVDVRTPGEYAGGNIEGSINIPVNFISGNTDLLRDKNRPVITCCASGIRSASAKSILISKGFTNVYNGGSWTSLKKKIG